MNIKFFDLKQQYNQIKQELSNAFLEVFETSGYSNGPVVESFEKEFAEFCNSKHCIAVNNGTSALHLALDSIGVGPGDEVILPSLTFIASAWGAVYLGATPVFADIDPKTWQIDTEHVTKLITKKTKAIIGVHLYGLPCDIEKLSEISKEHNLTFIEDASQAHGAYFKNNKVGSHADFVCFSFYPSKNLGACGEGGAICTNSDYHTERIKALRQHGSRIRYNHEMIGYNMRMGGFEAASLRVKLKYLDIWNERRREIAKFYNSSIMTNDKITRQFVPEDRHHVYHLYVISCVKRNELREFLAEKGIETGLHYPIPCHKQIAFRHLPQSQNSLRNSEYLSETCVSLPLYPELPEEQMSFVAESINLFYKGRNA